MNIYLKTYSHNPVRNPTKINVYLSAIFIFRKVQVPVGSREVFIFIFFYYS